MQRSILALGVICLLAGCRWESVDLTGNWEGTAKWVIDGEHKEVPLRLELVQAGDALSGAIVWSDYRREITAAKWIAPELRLESSASENQFLINGLFRNDAIEGRFSIQYAIDPEPYPGTFRVVRRP